MTTLSSSTSAEPAQTAVAACRAAGVTVQPLDTLAGVRAAEALFVEVWHSAPSAPPVTAEVMRAVEHAGGYVVGAYDGEQLVGASSGFLGFDEAGRPTLHSHITGVVAGVQGRGVGRALKLHQRAWSLARGVRAITWTFDPLVRRNAWFNLVKLGAAGVEYLVDFYGPMADGINAGQPTDRLFCRWDLVAPAVPADGDGGVVVLDERGGRPVVTGAKGDGPLLVRLPDDVERLRSHDPEAAAEWRHAVREVMVPALADGRSARGVTRDGALVLS